MHWYLSTWIFVYPLEFLPRTDEHKLVDLSVQRDNLLKKNTQKCSRVFSEVFDIMIFRKNYLSIFRWISKVSSKNLRILENCFRCFDKIAYWAIVLLFISRYCDSSQNFLSFKFWYIFFFFFFGHCTAAPLYVWLHAAGSIFTHQVALSCCMYRWIVCCVCVDSEFQRKNSLIGRDMFLYSHKNNANNLSDHDAYML